MLTPVALIEPGDRYVLNGEDLVCAKSAPLEIRLGGPDDLVRITNDHWVLTPTEGPPTTFYTGWALVERYARRTVHPGSKTWKTLRLIDALMGTQHTNLNPTLIEKNNAAWKAKSDDWVKDPASSPDPGFWDLQATIEHALKQPGRVFKHRLFKGWYTWEELKGSRSDRIRVLLKAIFDDE
jgi:hypothetical protein